MANPFNFHGKELFPEHFIGRKEKMDLLEERTTSGGLTCVVGLSRMGKSSLVKHCFIEDKRFNWWMKEKHLIPLYSTLKGFDNSPHSYFGYLANEMKNSLRKWKKKCDINDLSLLNDIINKFESVLNKESVSERFLLIIDCLSDLKEKDSFNIQFIFIIDELDSMLEPAWTKEHFGMFRTLSEYGPMITCSRRIPEYIEKEKYGSSYFENKSKKLFVGVFSDEEVEQYWKHFSHYFTEHGFDEVAMKRYRQLVLNYAGNQPHLMNLMNDWAFDNNILTEWNCASFDEKAELERKFRIYVKDAFYNHMDKVEEQGLKDTAVHLISGGLWEEPENYEKIVQMLLDYTFIQKVPSAIKRKMFGYDLGVISGNYRYVCISEFTSHLLHEEYFLDFSLKKLQKEDLTLNEWLWKTELMLRDLVRTSIREQCPDKKPFAVTKDDGTEQGYEEKWIEQYLKIVGNRTIKNGIDKIRTSRYKRIENSTKPKGEQNFDIISSATLGDILYIFIQWQWTKFYGCVFDSKKCTLQNRYVGNDKDFEDWCKTTFNDIKKARDAEAHRNLNDHTTDFIEDVKRKCKKVCDDIDNWKKNNKHK